MLEDDFRIIFFEIGGSDPSSHAMPSTAKEKAFQMRYFMTFHTITRYCRMVNSQSCEIYIYCLFKFICLKIAAFCSANCLFCVALHLKTVTLQDTIPIEICEEFHMRYYASLEHKGLKYCAQFLCSNADSTTVIKISLLRGKKNFFLGPSFLTPGPARMPSILFDSPYKF